MRQVDMQASGPAAEDLVSVVYSSVAAVEFTDADMAELLALSRLNNAPRHLTGMLLYRDGQFMQVLEGAPNAVRTALSSIAGDPRHASMWTLAEERIAKRSFGSWSMGYRELSSDDDQPPAWYGSPEASDRGEGQVSASRAGELLAWFRDH